jgi:asparagine synthase (glutamine-hydrolysing)
MVDCLHHRGPDDANTWLDGSVALANSRLSIIDVAGGRQPIANEDATIHVVFNGEIFNYLELRRELRARGHVFRTRSDTEVIVHAYEQHGLDFVQRLNGQFAIALWDGRKRQLVLARDRVGERPLFYTRAAGRLCFASEIKALFVLPEVERRIDNRGLAEALMFWAPQGTRSVFEGISSLEPGHVLCVDDQGQTEKRRYWDWSFPSQPFNVRAFDRTVGELRALLEDAVRLRLRADVPVGAYLSGGLDSSVTTALVNRLTDVPLRTFSLRFEDRELDESAFQDEIIAHLRVEHTSLLCTRQAIGDAFPRVVWHGESTLVRTAPTPLLLLSELVRAQGFKVVLSGEGADEVFGGYDLFREAKVRRFWARHPGSRLGPLLLSRLYPHLRLNPASVPAYARAFFGQELQRVDEPFFGHLLRWQTTRRSWSLLAHDVRASLRGWEPLEDLRQRLPPDIGKWEPLCRDQYIEAHTLLSSYLLSSQGDRMAMANGVEARMPFLDHRLIEFAGRLAPAWKVLGLREKHILKRATADLLPASIVRRPKQPFRAPDSQSFFRDGRPLPYVADLLSRPRIASAGLFDASAVSRLVKKCSAGRAVGFADNMAFVGVLSTMLVQHMFVENRGPIDSGPA